MCCSVLQLVAAYRNWMFRWWTRVCCSCKPKCVAACCSLLQYVVIWCFDDEVECFAVVKGVHPLLYIGFIIETQNNNTLQHAATHVWWSGGYSVFNICDTMQMFNLQSFGCLWHDQKKLKFFESFLQVNSGNPHFPVGFPFWHVSVSWRGRKRTSPWKTSPTRVGVFQIDWCCF